MHERLLVTAIPAGSELSSCCATFKLLGKVFMQLHVMHVSAFLLVKWWFELLQYSIVYFMNL